MPAPQRRLAEEAAEMAGGIETNAETDEGLGLGIVSVEHLTKGIGFSADAFDEGIVFLGVVTHRFEFIPEALDSGQALTGFL